MQLSRVIAAVSVGLGAALAALSVAGVALAATARAAVAQTQGNALSSGSDDTLVQARDALRRRDKAALTQARMSVNAAGHPLAQWVEYWELANRLTEAQTGELEAFYTRWAGTYVEDRLRNDWLLELGRRRDWAAFRADFPRFRMNDDREVTCYALLTQHLDGADVRSAARDAWFAQRDAGDGCGLLARTLWAARQLREEDVWQEARLSVEANRPRAARDAVTLIDPLLAAAVAEIFDNPARYLNRRSANAAAGTTAARELELLALIRAAANDAEAAAGLLEAATAQQRLTVQQSATAWAHVAKQAALKHLPEAAGWARRAWQQWDSANKPGVQPPWGDEVLAWHVRAALREDAGERGQDKRWALVQRAVDAMSAAEQRDAAWVYWKARATTARAKAGPDGDATRLAARAALDGIAGQLGFYGKLALEDGGGKVALPAAPAPLTPAEREAPRALPGFTRALKLIDIGLRNEGVREWNFTLRGMADRELLAAAQLACEHEVWDRCINTSDRTKTEIDVTQRFPTPFRDDVLKKSREAGLDAAVVYGLIRQESRFILDARSGVGASGLMQLMPATARWTAKKIGLPYTPAMITDRDVNLQLGAAYLKLVLDDFQGSLAMAAAAYNAGPGRPRKWREGMAAPMEAAAWAETIPFNETRDYVKKVLSNSIYYAALLGAPAPTLKSRLGGPIGPRPGGAPASDREIP